jgi:hypothetical protein
LFAVATAPLRFADLMTAAPLFRSARPSIRRSFLATAKQGLKTVPGAANHPTLRQLLLAKLRVQEDFLLRSAKLEDLLVKSRANQLVQVTHHELQEQDFVFQL